MASGVLRVESLGAITLRIDGGPPLAVASRKARALVALLACERQPQSRVALADLLWGDTDQPAALASLRTALSQLRRVVPHVRADRAWVWLDPTVVVDLEELAAIERGELDPAAALTLGTGPAFAEDLGPGAEAFEEWAEVWRAQANRRLVAALEAVAAQPSTPPTPETVRHRRAAAEQLLRLEPWNERAQATLAALLLADGRASAAAALLTEGAERLRREVGVEPGAELTRLAERARTEAARHDGFARSNRLPIPVGLFVGRTAELAALTVDLSAFRLLSLVGPGGSGKTRLALQLASSDAERRHVVFVELAALSDEDAVAHAVAIAVGVVAPVEGSIRLALRNALSLRPLLLVMDNCEHVLGAAADLIDELLTHCAPLTVLATSRETLGLAGERVRRIDGLLPDDAARLLRQRIDAVSPGRTVEDDTARQLCQQLDHLPLAIELVAARGHAFSPKELLAALEGGFALSSTHRSSTPRHRSLRDTIGWSFDRLAPFEQAMLEVASLFAGSFTIESLQAVFEATGERVAPALDAVVAALVDKSMLQPVSGSSSSRYRMLETLRQYAHDRLSERGALADWQLRYAQFWASWATRADAGLELDGPQDRHWWRMIGEEFDNLRAARLIAAQRDDQDLVEALVRGVARWAYWSHRSEVADWLALRPADHPEGPPRPIDGEAAARAALLLSVLCGRAGDARDLFERAGPLTATAAARFGMARFAGAALDPTNTAAILEAAQATREAAAQLDGWSRTLWGLSVAIIDLMLGDTRGAAAAVTELEEEATRGGNLILNALWEFVAGRVSALSAEPAGAIAHFGRTLAIVSVIDCPVVVGAARSERAAVLARQGPPSVALRELAGVAAEWIGAGDWMQYWTTLHHVALALVRAERTSDAKCLWAGLATRAGFASGSHRDELTAALGTPQPSDWSDREFYELVWAMLADELS